ncbi:MAG: hypothetical protein NXI04_15520 [Planctomycetaceae bacterium]|nr:hypothetical protein [Planctomycetaceae bacterium]
MTELTTADPQRPGTEPSQSRLLEMARSLDVFGRQAEQFLQQQLADLQFAMEELEREKSAWRRQMDRESRQLARQWEEIRQAGGVREHGVAADRQTQSRRSRAEQQARQSREAPLRLLLQPGRASALQVGLIVFEMSKLNREMGGRGLRFELDEVRRPVRGLFARKNAGESGEILELSVFSEQPLHARGQHVVMEVDITDRIENWIAFKSRLLQSRLVDEGLLSAFDKSRVTGDQTAAREILRDANRRVDDVDRNRQSDTCYSGSFQFVNTALDTVQQQVGRLEGCCERLTRDTSLKLHITVHTVR